MSARAVILAELRELRRLAEIRLPQAERADVVRRIRNYQRELCELRGRRRPGRCPFCRCCGRKVAGKAYRARVGLGRAGPFCSESCYDLWEDERFRI